MKRRAFAPFLALILVLVTGCTSLSSESQHLKVTFVYDISLSARSWTPVQIESTKKWLEEKSKYEITIGVETIDAYGGSVSCAKPSQTTISGKGGNNEATQKVAKEEALEKFTFQLASWLNCESEDTAGKGGSDIDFSQLTESKNIVIFSDGLLRMPSIADKLEVTAASLSNPDTLEDFKTILLNNKNPSLEGAKVSVYGLGYRKTFSSEAGQKLADFWYQLLESLGAAEIYLSRSPNVI